MKIIDLDKIFSVDTLFSLKSNILLLLKVHIYSELIKSNLTRTVRNTVSFSFFIQEGSLQTHEVPLSSNSMQSEAHLPIATITGSYVPLTVRFVIFSP